MIFDNPKRKSHLTRRVTVNAFARLHMGFIDLNGSLGKRFGSLGVGLDAPDTLVELAIGKDVFGLGPEPSHVARHKQRLLQHLQEQCRRMALTEASPYADGGRIPDAGIPDISIKVHREIPRHFGLGSGTQMALAIGEGLNQLFDVTLSPSEIAAVTARGQRSGIGIGTFAAGGFVIDDGRRAETIVPEIIAQHAFPEAWRILLIFDHQHVGVHGDQERAAFAALPDADLAATNQINQLVMAQALPAIRAQDLKKFGDVVAVLQAYTGDYFAPAQGGRYASDAVAAVLKTLMQVGVHCVGQSSWGPTGFAVFESQAAVDAQLDQLKKHFPAEHLTFQICAARNQGACVN